jgi:inorganic triphosphatase YgiF
MKRAGVSMTSSQNALRHLHKRFRMNVSARRFDISTLYAGRYALARHEAAAYVIVRRGLHFRRKDTQKHSHADAEDY